MPRLVAFLAAGLLAESAVLTLGALHVGPLRFDVVDVMTGRTSVASLPPASDTRTEAANIPGAIVPDGTEADHGGSFAQEAENADRKAGQFRKQIKDGFDPDKDRAETQRLNEAALRHAKEAVDQSGPMPLDHDSDRTIGAIAMRPWGVTLLQPHHNPIEAIDQVESDVYLQSATAKTAEDRHKAYDYLTQLEALRNTFRGAGVPEPDAAPCVSLQHDPALRNWLGNLEASHETP